MVNFSFFHIFLKMKGKNYITDQLTSYELSWRNTTLGDKCIAKQIFNHVFFTNWIGRWILTIKRPRSYRNVFLLHIIFFWRIFCIKNLDISLLDTLCLFLLVAFPISLSHGCLFLQFFLQWQHGVHPHVFSRPLFHWFCNMILFLSLPEFLLN